MKERKKKPPRYAPISEALPSRCSICGGEQVGPLRMGAGCHAGYSMDCRGVMMEYGCQGHIKGAVK